MPEITMRRAALAAVLFAAFAITGCTASGQPDEESAATPAATRTSAPAPEVAEEPSTLETTNSVTGTYTAIPAECAGSSGPAEWVTLKNDGGQIVEFPGLVDLGPRPNASGEVTYNDAGELATYVVAAGDTPYGLTERFCTVPYYSEALNAVRRNTALGGSDFQLFAGDVLNLHVDTIATVGDENGIVHSYEQEYFPVTVE